MWQQQGGKEIPDPNNANQWQQQQQYNQQPYANYYGRPDLMHNDPAAWAQKAAEWVKHKQSLPQGNEGGHFAYGNEMKFDGRHPSHFHHHDANFEQDRLQHPNMDNYNYNTIPGNERFYDNEPPPHYLQHPPTMQMGPDSINPNQAPYPYHRQDAYPETSNTFTNFDNVPNPEASFGYGYDQYMESAVAMGPELDTSNASIPTVDSAKKKTLPLWLRQGLEKLERDKQKKSQQETLNASLNKSDKLSTSLNYSGYVFEASPENSPSPNQEAESVLSDSEPYKADEITEELTDINIIKEHCFKSEQDVLIHVRKMLTEILLEVTDEMIQTITTECLQAMKSATATVLASSSALAALGGLGGSDQDSDEDDNKYENTEKLSTTRTQLERSSDNVKTNVGGEGETTRHERDNKQHYRRSSNDRSNQDDYSRKDYHTHHRSRHRSRSRSRSYSPRRRRSGSSDNRRTSHSDKYKSSRHHRDLSSSPESHRYRRKSVRK